MAAAENVASIFFRAKTTIHIIEGKHNGNALKDGRPKTGLGNGLGALREAVRIRTFHFFFEHMFAYITPPIIEVNAYLWRVLI